VDLWPWEDYDGDTPALDQMDPGKQMRGIMILTDMLDPSLPVPDLGNLNDPST
jgi:hypothetical protein